MNSKTKARRQNAQYSSQTLSKGLQPFQLKFSINTLHTKKQGETCFAAIVPLLFFSFFVPQSLFSLISLNLQFFQ